MTDKEEHGLWKRHRRIIEREFSKKGTRLIDVIEYMATHHDFVRSKTQYERQLKKWGVRKKLTKSEWIAILFSICENARFNRNVEVLWHGSRLPPAQIEREIKRYGSEVARQSGLRAVRRALPRYIEIQPKTSVSTTVVAERLQMVRPPPTRPRTVSPPLGIPQDLSCLQLELIESPYIMDHCSMNSHVLTSVQAPFSWLQSIRTIRFSSSNEHMQHMILADQPTKLQLDATFYPVQEEFRSAILYQMASLINDMVQASQRTPGELHNWLSAIPLPTLIQNVDALPVGVFEALRERMFVLAVTAGHADIVSAMLALHIDPNQPVMTGPAKDARIYPLEYAVHSGNFFVARKILLHMLEGSTISLKAELFRQILTHQDMGPNRKNSKRLNATELQELVGLLLEAGARPYERCIAVFSLDHSFTEWIRFSKVGLIPWLELAVAPISRSGPLLRALPAVDLRYLIFERFEDLQEESPDLGILLLDLATRALKKEDKSRLEILLPAVVSLGCRADTIFAFPDPAHAAYKQACSECDWSMAASLVIEKEKAMKAAPQIKERPVIQPWLQDLMLEELEEEILAEHRENILSDLHAVEYDEKLEAMIQEKYEELTGDIVLKYNEEWEVVDAIHERALNLRHIPIAAILHDFAQSESFSSSHFFTLLQLGDASMCSEYTLRLSGWSSLLDKAAKADEVGELAAMVLQDPVLLVMGIAWSPKNGGEEIYRQICLRVLGFHAIASNDLMSFKKALHLGLDTDEVYWFLDPNAGEEVLEKTPLKRGTFPRSRNHDLGVVDGCHIIPSFLAAVAGQENILWIDHLCTEGVNMRDSMALLWAVNKGARIETIRKLLQAARSQQPSRSDEYGSAALRRALRLRRLDVASLLCEEVDIDTIEWSTEEWLAMEKAVTPLGEAIYREDFHIAQWLLDHGANPNAWVTRFGSAPMPGDTDSYLPLETPLLSAISKRSLPMVELLVKNGATINDSRKSGLTRTPLQRAAEVGHFDIVKYFIDQNAQIDTSPAYSGGTALQLAAMSGHVGIATLLLERGADTNHPPAKGDGRTAFEAAVECARVDMVSLLMRNGVDLDMKVGDLPETQYERARRFAERNGKFASKREAERLYTQFQAQRRAETPRLSLQMGHVEELWSPGPMPEPTW